MQFWESQKFGVIFIKFILGSRVLYLNWVLFYYNTSSVERSVLNIETKAEKKKTVGLHAIIVYLGVIVTIKPFNNCKMREFCVGFLNSAPSVEMRKSITKIALVPSVLDEMNASASLQVFHSIF